MVDALGMGVGFNALIAIISLIVMIPLSALGLWISGKIFKIKIDYVKALLPAAILVGVGFLISIPQWFMTSIAIMLGISGLGFIVGLALYLTLPKLFFNLEWGKGLLVGLVWFGIMLVAGFIVGIVIGLVGFAIAMAVGLAAV